MSDSFLSVIQNFEGKATEGLQRAFKNSVIDILGEMTNHNLMPEDTGYLQNSHVVSTVSMPMVDENSVPASREPFQFPLDTSKAVSDIQKIENPETIYIGFTAAYAGYQETLNGFVRLPVQNWNSIVQDNIKKVEGTYKPKTEAQISNELLSSWDSIMS